MGKIERLTEDIEIAAPILGCTRREDCEASSLPLACFSADVARLEKGIEPQHGLTIEMLLEDRVTFMAMCNARRSEEAGACALGGTFVPTTPEMVAAQNETPVHLNRN